MSEHEPPAVTPEAATHRSQKPAYAALGLTAVLVAAGGAAVAYGQLSGAGSQPSEALPGNAVGY